MRPGPPCADDLRNALDLVTHPGLEAIALLALPLDELPRAALQLRAGAWEWRGEREPITADPVEAITRLVARGARPSDRFVDLEAMPWDWLRPLRSGCRTVVLGFDVFLGGPALTVEAGAEHLLEDLVEAWVDGHHITAPGVLELPAGLALIDGDNASWVLRTGPGVTRSTSFVPTEARRVRRLVGHLSASGVSALEVLEAGPSQYILSGVLPGGWAIDLPVECDGATTMVGVRPHETREVPTEALPVTFPDGWLLAGRHAGDLVGVGAGGLWAYLRPISSR